MCAVYLSRVACTHVVNSQACLQAPPIASRSAGACILQHGVDS